MAVPGGGTSRIRGACLITGGGGTSRIPGACLTPADDGAVQRSPPAPAWTTYRDGMVEPAAGATEALAAIARRDPGFDLEAFLSEAASVYLQVDRARVGGSGATVRPLVADSAWSELHLDGPPERGPAATPVLSEPEVTRATTDSLDTIVVRFPATRRGERSVEDWTFQRPATAVTGAPVAAQCPQCGARDSLAPDGRCRYCGAASAPERWRVTRATTLDAGTAGDAQRTGAALVQAIAAYSAAAGGVTTESPRSLPSARSGCGCGMVFWTVCLLAFAATGMTIYGWLAPTSAVHPLVASIVPGTRRARLTGRLTASGGVAGTASFVEWWPSPVHCADLAAKATALSATVDLGDGSTLAVAFRSENGPFGTASLTQQQLTVVPSYDRSPAGVHQVWSPSSPGATVRLVVTGDGSGEASFSGLRATLSDPGAPTGPLGGSLRWTCRDA